MVVRKVFVSIEWQMIPIGYGIGKESEDELMYDCASSKRQSE